MSRPCGQTRLEASRRGRQGSTLPLRSRRAWTGPNDGAVKVANTHGCSATDSGTPLPPIRPDADELAGVALVDGRAGRAGRFTAVAARDVQHVAGFGVGAVGGGRLAGGQVDGGDAAAQPDRAGAGVGGGELAFPVANCAESSTTRASATGGLPQSRKISVQRERSRDGGEPAAGQRAGRPGSVRARRARASGDRSQRTRPDRRGRLTACQRVAARVGSGRRAVISGPGG